MNVQLNETQALLLPTGGVFFPEFETLLVSDLHIGKASHFRKNGIAISHMVDDNNLWKLSGDMLKYKPAAVIFLGDLFHSTINEECERFADFMANFDDVQWHLVEGNHDILHPDFYSQSGIMLHKGIWEWNGISFSHEHTEADHFNIAGHIHPGVRMRGVARQSIRLACFHVHQVGMTLPAYGCFTGRHTIKPKKGDQVFGLLENEVILL